MENKLRGFDFLYTHPLLKMEYVVEKSTLKEHMFEFKDHTMFLQLRVPYKPGRIHWSYGFNNGMSFYHSGLHPTVKLPTEFREIIQEASASLEKRDRLRNLF